MTRQAGAPNVITLQEPTAMKKRTRYLLSTKYIYDCVDFGEVLDHKPYMHEEIGTKRPPRKKYTIEDDARMLEFIKVRPQEVYYTDIHPSARDRPTRIKIQ